MQFDPITQDEVFQLGQPFVVLFHSNHDTGEFGYLVIYRNEEIEWVGTKPNPENGSYFFDPLTTYSVMKNRRLSRDNILNKSIARKVTLDTHRSIISTFLSKKLDDDYWLYLDGCSTVFNLPNRTVKLSERIISIITKFNQGRRYMEGPYDKKYFIGSERFIPSQPGLFRENGGSIPHPPSRSPPRLR